MTTEEAKIVLKHHSFQHPDYDHPKSKSGFLGSLRPFKGELLEENYHEVMRAIMVLSDQIRSDQFIDRQIISSIWGICHLSRAWAVEDAGMLKRNNLISNEQSEILLDWIEVISYSMCMLLDGCNNETAFMYYAE